MAVCPLLVSVFLVVAERVFSYIVLVGPSIRMYIDVVAARASRAGVGEAAMEATSRERETKVEKNMIIEDISAREGVDEWSPGDGDHGFIATCLYRTWGGMAYATARC